MEDPFKQRISPAQSLKSIKTEFENQPFVEESSQVDGEGEEGPLRQPQPGEVASEERRVSPGVIRLNIFLHEAILSLA